MSKRGLPIPSGLPTLLKEIKARIRQAQTRAILSANAELVQLYWDSGRLIDERQEREGWGAGVIPRLSRELRDELPEIKGFSERNIQRMVAFYRQYTDAAPKGPPPVAQLAAETKVPPPVAQLPALNAPATCGIPGGVLWAVPWAHHVVLIEKVKDVETRLRYMQQTLADGWSRNVLLTMIQSEAHQRQGTANPRGSRRTACRCCRPPGPSVRPVAAWSTPYNTPPCRKPSPSSGSACSACC